MGSPSSRDWVGCAKGACSFPWSFWRWELKACPRGEEDNFLLLSIFCCIILVGGKPLAAVNVINKPSWEAPPHPVCSSRRKQTISKAHTLLCSRWETLAWKPRGKEPPSSGLGRFQKKPEALRPLHAGQRPARTRGGQRVLPRGWIFQWLVEKELGIAALPCREKICTQPFTLY